MLIRNLTSKQQKVVVKEVTGENRKFDLFLEPHGTTDLNLMLVVDPANYAGIIEIEGFTKEAVQEVKIEPVVVTEEVEVTPEEEIVEESKEEEVQEEPTKTQDSFICDVCGAEYASARGLATHKHKAHE